MIRVLAAAPFILAGQLITEIGYAVAGAPHLNPHRRLS